MANWVVLAFVLFSRCLKDQIYKEWLSWRKGCIFRVLKKASTLQWKKAIRKTPRLGRKRENGFPLNRQSLSEFSMHKRQFRWISQALSSTGVLFLWASTHGRFPAVWGLYLPNSRMVQVCNHKDFNVRDALQGVIQNYKGNICFHFSIMYFSIENVPRHCMQLKQVESRNKHSASHVPMTCWKILKQQLQPMSLLSVSYFSTKLTANIGGVSLHQFQHFNLHPYTPIRPIPAYMWWFSARSLCFSGCLIQF